MKVGAGREMLSPVWGLGQTFTMTMPHSRSKEKGEAPGALTRGHTCFISLNKEPLNEVFEGHYKALDLAGS